MVIRSNILVFRCGRFRLSGLCYEHSCSALLLGELAGVVTISFCMPLFVDRPDLIAAWASRWRPMSIVGLFAFPTAMLTWFIGGLAAVARAIVSARGDLSGRTKDPGASPRLSDP